MKRLLLVLLFVAPLVAAACVDSDGGRAYTEFGVCEDAFKERSDSCTITQSGENSVIEYYCAFKDRGECRPVTFACKDVEGATGECVDGACVLESEVKVEPTIEVVPINQSEEPLVEEKPYEPSYYYEEEKPKAVDDWMGWLALFLIAVGFVTVYNYSTERKENKKKGKRSKK